MAYSLQVVRRQAVGGGRSVGLKTRLRRGCYRFVALVRVNALLHLSPTMLSYSKPERRHSRKGDCAKMVPVRGKVRFYSSPAQTSAGARGVRRGMTFSESFESLDSKECIYFPQPDRWPWEGGHVTCCWMSVGSGWLERTIGTTENNVWGHSPPEVHDERIVPPSVLHAQHWVPSERCGAR